MKYGWSLDCAAWLSANGKPLKLIFLQWWCFLSFFVGLCEDLKTLYLICVPQGLGGEREGGRLRSFLQNPLEVPVVFASWLNSWASTSGLPWTERWHSLISHLLSVAVLFPKGAQGLQKPAAHGGDAMLLEWWMSCKTRLQSTVLFSCPKAFMWFVTY